MSGPGESTRNPFEQYPKRDISCASCYVGATLVGVLPMVPTGWESFYGGWCCPAKKCRKLLAEAKEYAKTHNRDGTKKIVKEQQGGA